MLKNNKYIVENTQVECQIHTPILHKKLHIV